MAIDLNTLADDANNETEQARNKAVGQLVASIRNQLLESNTHLDPTEQATVALRLAEGVENVGRGRVQPNTLATSGSANASPQPRVLGAAPQAPASQPEATVDPGFERYTAGLENWIARVLSQHGVTGYKTDDDGLIDLGDAKAALDQNLKKMVDDSKRLDKELETAKKDLETAKNADTKIPTDSVIVKKSDLTNNVTAIKKALDVKALELTGFNAKALVDGVKVEPELIPLRYET